MANLHCKILDIPLPRSNFLDFYAVFEREMVHIRSVPPAKASAPSDPGSVPDIWPHSVSLQKFFDDAASAARLPIPCTDNSFVCSNKFPLTSASCNFQSNVIFRYEEACLNLFLCFWIYKTLRERRKFMWK